MRSPAGAWTGRPASSCFRPRVHDGGTKTVFGKSGAVRRRRRARSPACAPGDRAARDGEAVARIRLAGSRSGGSATHRARFVESRTTSRWRCATCCSATRSTRPKTAACSSSRRPNSSSARCARSASTPEQVAPFAIAAAGMGQNLMSPPNVKGWPGGETWINTTTLLARKQFVDRVTRADGVACSANR